MSEPHHVISFSPHSDPTSLLRWNSTHTLPAALQILKATAAKPVRILVGMLNRTPGAYINAYTSKGTVYVAVRGRALVAGPFAVPKTKTVLRAGTAVRQLRYFWPCKCLGGPRH